MQNSHNLDFNRRRKKRTLKEKAFFSTLSLTLLWVSFRCFALQFTFSLRCTFPLIDTLAPIKTFLLQPLSVN
jgi:hypothetical protein